jgi:alkylated DNA nucleotide flippase Atl1
MKSRKTWREKIDGAPAAKVVPLPAKRMPALVSLPKGATILIPHPRDVEALMQKVPKGKLVTQTELRSKLARDAKADVACPITTGIFVRIVAEAAEEALRAGKARVTPYWRVVRDNGQLIEKLPGGPTGMAERLADEGHKIDMSGKIRVSDVEKKTIRYT